MLELSHCNKVMERTEELQYKKTFVSIYTCTKCNIEVIGKRILGMK